MKTKLGVIFTSLLIIIFGVSCRGEDNEGLHNKDIVGNWVRPKYSLKMRFNKVGTYDYYDHGIYKENLSGRYSYDADKQVWVELRNDGHSYTNYILLLDENTFSYIDNYGNTYIWEKEH